MATQQVLAKRYHFQKFCISFSENKSLWSPALFLRTISSQSWEYFISERYSRGKICFRQFQTIHKAFPNWIIFISGSQAFLKSCSWYFTTRNFSGNSIKFYLISDLMHFSSNCWWGFLMLLNALRANICSYMNLECSLKISTILLSKEE